MPYARVTTFKLKPGHQQQAQPVMDHVLNETKKLAGFQSITVFHDDSYETVGAFSIWDTRADAEGATPGMRDIVQRQMQQALAGPPSTQIYEVYSEPVQTFPIGRP